MLNEVLSKWINIRANLFVKTFVLIFKRKMNNMLNDKKKQQPKSSEPAMRKNPYIAMGRSIELMKLIHFGKELDNSY